MIQEILETFNFETGDLLLFNGNHLFSPIGIFSYFIKFFTRSNWSHIGMIVKDPPFNIPNGIYVWQSSYDENAEDNKTELGVELTPIKEVLNNYKGIIHWRKLNSGNVKITNEKLKEIHHLVHGKPYDINPIDWFNALIQHQSTRIENRFFCSALIGCIYSFLNLIDPKIDWSIIKPSDFSSEYPNNIKFINHSSLGPEIEIHNN